MGNICIELSNCRTIHLLLVVHYDLGNVSPIGFIAYVQCIACRKPSGTDDTFS